jgi:hypothetical protein
VSTSSCGKYKNLLQSHLISKTSLRFITTIFAAIFLVSSATAVEFFCQYSGSYSCTAFNATINTLDDALIGDISGFHLDGKTNTDVTNFDARALIIRYFPKYLGIFFPNLDKIFIEGGMYELHKEDIQNLPKLKTIFMSNNNIEYLEKDLFINHPYIELLYFESNNIKYVDPNVFDNLSKLVVLSLYRNTCSSLRASKNRSAVLSAIPSIISSCGIGANPQVQTIFELQTELELLNLVNGNLTVKCASKVFSGAGVIV